MMGLKRSRHAWRMESCGDRCCSRSACSAKSTIMMPFFFTMPISRMMPISAITDRSICSNTRMRSAPTPAEGSVDRMVRG